jgi:hypothetical protein
MHQVTKESSQTNKNGQKNRHFVAEKQLSTYLRVHFLFIPSHNTK